MSYGRVSRRRKVFYDAVQIIHHFPPRTMPHESSPWCASRPPRPHHQRAIQYVRAMALSIPSAPPAAATPTPVHQQNNPQRGAHGNHEKTRWRSSDGESRLLRRVLEFDSGSLLRFPFIRSFPPILAVKEPAHSGSAAPIGPFSFM